MADVAAQQLPQQGAGRYHRWLQDDAVKLQMQEVLGNWDLFQFAPDRMKAKALFVGLCFIRRSNEFRHALDDEVEKLRHRPGWNVFTTWWTMRQYNVIHQPEENPFALTDDEFDYYSIKNFGGRFPWIKATWHPQNFYQALAEDALALIIGVMAAKGVNVYIPEAPVLSEAGAASFATRAALAKGANMLAHKALPGGAWDVAKKDMLFPRYELEARRRALG